MEELFIPSSIGRKIENLRRLRGISQEALSKELNISRKTYRNILTATEVDDQKLEQIAKALGSSIEVIKNFAEETVLNIIQHNYEGSESNYSGVSHSNIHSPEKVMELVEENRKLYERLLESEKEKNMLLQKLVDQLQKLLDQKAA